MSVVYCFQHMPDVPDDPQQLGRNARAALKEYRMNVVRRLIIRGIDTSAEITEQLASLKKPILVDQRTVRRWMAEIKLNSLKAASKKEGLDKTIDELVIDLKEQFDEVNKELWKVYHNPATQSAAKVAALKAIREGAEEWIEKLQVLGLVATAPQTHQMLGADGKPIDPTTSVVFNTDKMVLNQQFNSFIKTLHQDPISELPQSNENR